MRFQSRELAVYCNFSNVHAAWSAMKEVFFSVLDKHVPCVNLSEKQAMFKRNWLKRKASKTGSLNNWEAYRKQRN